MYKNPSKKCCHHKCKKKITTLMEITNICLKCKKIFCNNHRYPETHECVPIQELTQLEYEQQIINAIDKLSVNPNKRKINKI